ncbi:MAG: methylmalonyl Co-A mutase-associated GTPase MeaB [Bacteroidetes bacterium]|nr:methylmalonyl Co-A mutase-associated GTPase MeaB [Bacteroidota bacterium]MCB9043972.1 methylmalonyl Co-A mutase-associated GTPase MeaB [Chitinophagales bacterium]
MPQAKAILENLPTTVSDTPVIGFTGPPGAGKSSLLNALLENLLLQNKKVAVLAIDPSSPFNFGALLGDRIRFNSLFNHPDLYLRSIATRGSLGGLSENIIEICDVVRSYPFDYIFIETVGVGQSEIEIAGLADLCVLVLVPEAGDDVQMIKAGIMEIGDIFVINKADRPDADKMYHRLRKILAPATLICQTIATQKKGIDHLFNLIEQKLHSLQNNHPRKIALLAQKAWQLIQQERMQDIRLKDLQNNLQTAISQKDFNLYLFVKNWF